MKSDFKKWLQTFSSLLIFCGSAVAVMNYQNCSKTRTISSSNNQSSTNPSPTATPTNTYPTTICDTALLDNPEWTTVWGKKVSSAKVPNVRACTTSGPSISFSEPTLIGTISATNVYAAGQVSRARFGSKKRQADISFMVPDTAFAKWSSISAMSAYDLDSGSRLGATVTKDTLYVEFNDTKCSSSQKLYQGLPIVGALKANNWYRVFSQIKDLGNNTLEVNASLSDLQAGIQIIQTVYTSTCLPQWYYGSNNSWFFSVSAQSTESGVPPFETHLNDFNGLVE